MEATVPQTTHTFALDLHALRKDAHATLANHTLPRYDEVLVQITEKRVVCEALATAIERRMSTPDTSVSATLTECRTVAQRPIGPGLVSADDLHTKLARTVLELADILDLLA